ncbi:MAG TPA: hypothetical protein VM366_00775 [Anaerolineae bacterium]|nr:hypothetical protein [Anaerolineae bacterium]
MPNRDAYGSIGANYNTAGQQVLNDPYQLARFQADYAPEAYGIAARMMAPGAPGGQYGPSNEFMFTGPAQQLNQIGQQQHPGMSDPEFQQALRATQRSGSRRSAEMAHQMGGASGVDPSAYYRASQGMAGEQQAAMGGLHAQRAAMDRDTLMRATQSLAPYMKESAGMMQDYSQNVAGLAGNIINSSPYVVGTPPTGPTYTGGWGMGWR